MTTTSDLFDQDLLSEMIAGGYVRVQQHPTCRCPS
jgi:hypothetical protein